MSFCACQPAAPKLGASHPQNLCMRLVNCEDDLAVSEPGAFICCFYSRVIRHTALVGAACRGPKIVVSVSCALRLNEGNRSRNRDIPSRTSKTPDPQTTSALFLHVILSGWCKDISAASSPFNTS